MLKIKNKDIFQMSKDHHPVAKIKSGEKVEFITKDCFNNQITSEEVGIDSLDWDRINPATGPLFVEDAMPGDTLKVTIEKIEIDEYGVMAAVPENGVLGRDVEKGEVRKIRVKDGIVYFSEDITFPFNPMIGVIGVAPESGSISCGEPGAHGGNMDNTKIAQGASLYLPVFHEGALLSMGDLHGCMGDGEIMVSGLEIQGSVTVKVEVIKGLTIENPRIINATHCYTIASHESIEEAIYIATKDMAKLLMKKRQLSFNVAGMLLSAVGNLQFCQVVDPKRTVRMEISREILNSIEG